MFLSLPELFPEHIENPIPGQVQYPGDIGAVSRAYSDWVTAADPWVALQQIA
jgi:hypothetical protein